MTKQGRSDHPPCRPVTLSPCHPVTLSCCFLVCFVLGCTVIAGAEPPAAPVKAAENAPPPAVEQAKIDKAIHDGAWYLANNQLPYGMWTDGKGGTAIGHDVAYAALPGLTMLECGVPPTYEGVQRAAQFVRLRSPNLAQTYDLALAVLFLDKLGDQRDKELIEVLTMRLVAGQTTNGGWSYRCPILLPGEHRELLTALQVLTPPIPAPPPPAHPAADAARLATTVNSQAGVPRPPTLQIDRNPQNSNNLLPAQQPAGTPSPVPVPAPVVAPPLTMGQAQPAADAARLATSVNPPQPIMPVISEAERRRQAEFLFATRVLPNLSDKVKRMAVLGDVVPVVPADPRNRSGTRNEMSDNSNTQFALMAVWAARRNGVPVDRSLQLISQRFRSSQNANGSWSYSYMAGGGATGSQTMTCVGMLGLAVGHGLAYEAALRERPQFSNDVLILAEFCRVQVQVSGIFSSSPSGPFHVLPWLPLKPVELPDIYKRPNLKAAQDDPLVQKGFAALSKTLGKPVGRTTTLPQGNLYFLWSVERVGVLYNRRMIDDKDWYGWGAEKLIANQQPDGSWTNGMYVGHTPTVDTCLALLFLKKVNLVEDLTRKVAEEEPPTKVAERLPAMSLPELRPAVPAPPPPPLEVSSTEQSPEHLASETPQPLDIPPTAELEKPDDTATQQAVGQVSNLPPQEPPAPARPPANRNPSAKRGYRWWPLWLLAGAGLLILAGSGGYFAYRLSRKPRKKAQANRNGIRKKVAPLPATSPAETEEMKNED